MIVWIGVFLVALGFAWGYGIRDLQERRAQRKACKRVEQDLHITQGAAYDACEPVTDYDAEAVRKLLSW